MSNHFLKTALTLAALMCTFAPRLAAQSKAAATGDPDAPRPTPKAKPRPARKPKAAPTANLIDINSAPKEALVKLPGVTPELAERIMIGRPYPTKARLLNNAVIPSGVYQSIHKLIIAKQTPKTLDQLLGKKK